VNNIPLQRLLADYDRIPKDRLYNWMRILSGEPLQNDEYINYLFNFLLEIAKRDTSCFRNGIIIQTNGIHIGLHGAQSIGKHLKTINEINPNLKIIIEVSIKGTNPDEFELISRSSKTNFPANINAYYKLKEINVSNLRPTIIAGFGISESLLLTRGRSGKSIMTILFNNDTPIFHPSIWSDSFKELYECFIMDWKRKNSVFEKMPMYVIKDKFNYMWVKYSLKQAKSIYGGRFYDSAYSPRNQAVEIKIMELLDFFFLLSNQDYYSELIS